MDLVGIAGIVGALVALYAAGLSTYTFIKNQREKRPQLKVVLSHGATVYPRNLKRALLIKVSNPGQRTITVTSVQLELPDGNSVFMFQLPGSVTLPTELLVGQNAQFYMETHPLAESLQEGGWNGDVSLIAVCFDGNENKYRSKSLTFDIPFHLARPD